MRYVICFRDSSESSCSVVALSWDNPPPQRPLSPPESRLVQLGTRVAWLPMIHDLDINNDIDNRWIDRQAGRYSTSNGNQVSYAATPERPALLNCG